MNEHYTPRPESEPEQTPAATEIAGTPRPAPERVVPDWRRFEVTAKRFKAYIDGGIYIANRERKMIDRGTAQCVAHVVGRALGRDSALADYGRGNDQPYEALRDEYIYLLRQPDASEELRELVNRLGTFLVRQSFPTARTTEHYEPYPLPLEKLLVPTFLEIDEHEYLVHVPGTCDSADIEELTGLLEELDIDKDRMLEAYLSLPDVNAMSGDIMEGYESNIMGSWRSMEDAVAAVCGIEDRERDVADYAAERHLYPESMNPDYEALKDEAAEAFDFVEKGGWVYVFHK